MKQGVEQYISSGGARIYRIPLHLFPGMYGYAHLVIDGEQVSLFDVGSGFGDSNEDLERGLEEIQQSYEEPFSWDRLAYVFISHGHIDHFGGLHFVRSKTSAPIVIHELERRVLTNYESRLGLIADRLERFWEESGVPEDERQELMQLYLLHKQLFTSIDVQATFEELGMQAGKIVFEHVPGHCPGQVIAWVDDILLAGDHILKETSPHQAPESLSLNMGLEHYLNSLAKILPRSPKASWTLGGHEAAVNDLKKRIVEIVRVHRERLALLLEHLDQPTTTFELAKKLFPNTEGYHRLLALEEAGAHIEYLHTRGYVAIQNGASKEQVRNHTQQYVRLGGVGEEFPGMKIFHDSNLVHEPDLTDV